MFKNLCGACAIVSIGAFVAGCPTMGVDEGHVTLSAGSPSAVVTVTSESAGRVNGVVASNDAMISATPSSFAGTPQDIAISTSDFATYRTGQVRIANRWSPCDATTVYVSVVGTPEVATWISTFGGDDWDWGGAVRQLPDGGFLAGGGTESFDDDEFQLYLVRTDALGNEVSSVTAPYNGDADAEDLCVTDDGGLVAVSWRDVGDSLDAYVVRTDGDGALIWETALGEPGASSEYALAVAGTADGGFIVAGRRELEDAAYTNSAMYCAKLDGDGDLLWQNTFARGRGDVAAASHVLETADGEFILSGYTAPGAPVLASTEYVWRRHAYFVKVDAQGDRIWSRVFRSPLAVEGTVAAETADGDLYLAVAQGFTIGWTTLFKTNAHGIACWQRALPLTIEDIEIADNGDILLAGDTTFTPKPRTVYTSRLGLMRLDAAGDLIWKRAMDGSVRDLLPTDDGGAVFVGGTTSSSDLQIVKTDPNGAPCEWYE